jgi:hypothetical protein
MRSLIRGSLFAGVAIADHSSSMRRHLRTHVSWSISTRCPLAGENDERTPEEADVRGGQDPMRSIDPDARPRERWPGGGDVLTG